MGYCGKTYWFESSFPDEPISRVPCLPWVKKIESILLTDLLTFKDVFNVKKYFFEKSLKSKNLIIY